MRTATEKKQQVTDTTKAKKRKIIDLDEGTFRTLSVHAASTNTNLKALIEQILKEQAKDYEDSALYAYLSKNNPEGKDYLDKKEQDDFENWLGL